MQEDLQQQLDRMQTTLQQVWCTEVLSIFKHCHTDLARTGGMAVVYRSFSHFPTLFLSTPTSTPFVPPSADPG